MPENVPGKNCGYMTMPRLMIVDDQRGVLESLKLALDGEFEILTAMSGEECLRLLPAFRPDLILSDYRMRELDGLQLLEALAKEPHRSVVILYSCSMTPDLSGRALKLGAVDCLSKPFDLMALKEKLHQALGNA